MSAVKNKQDLTERLLSGELVYDGALLKVRRDVVRLPDGREASREYVRHPGAVAVVALFPDGRVLLERQYRHPLAREFLELPAGKLEPGEPHLETAKRELLEETGYAAAEWTRLGLIHVSVGCSDEAIELWLARGLEQRGARPDADEFLETFVVALEEAVAMVRDGRITDAKSVAGLLWMRAFGAS
ncbi:MAG: NUDIX hydrolase [Betaproteobacteria bacterium RIFCSPHIGHO2_12_FULL_69_13]|nr:MAG: NUDIX hydrolase [Betaproteobacteria bacterium RIFCSPHIGHO2_12_FULL_69_13]OGA70626.1 MAG: NUDIX hydrolase [Betaproteobacteria bacterium RIFCSPLOWO2_12_FULL_68_20]